MFNKADFDAWRVSGAGADALKFWADFPTFIKNENAAALAAFMNSHSFDKTREEFVAVSLQTVTSAVAYQRREFAAENEAVIDIESAHVFYRFFIELTLENWQDEPPEEMPSHIGLFSLVLSALHPEYFFPYYFLARFYKLAGIFEAAGITLPNLPPGQQDAKVVFEYYFDLCRALYSWRQVEGLTSPELMAFLYGYAWAEEDVREECLPPPAAAWFAEVTRGDTRVLIARATAQTKTHWPVSTGVRPGDLVLTRSKDDGTVSSVWRAITPGFCDPFCPWPLIAWVGYPVKVARDEKPGE